MSFECEETINSLIGNIFLFRRDENFIFIQEFLDCKVEMMCAKVSLLVLVV